jgi:hypothetical protein
LLRKLMSLLSNLMHGGAVQKPCKTEQIKI